MKGTRSLVFLCVTAAWAQAPTAQVKPDTVVAIVNNKPVTAAEFERTIAVLPPAQKATAMRNPLDWLQRRAIFESISDLGEKNKLQDESPYREQLDFARRQILFQAEINKYSNDIPILPEDQKKYYEEHKDRFKEAKGKLIKVAATKNGRSEAQSLARAEEVVKKARSGAEFSALVKEYSDDPETSKQGGDFTVNNRPGSLIPEAVRTKLLALKNGEVTDPIKHEAGYFVFKAETIETIPYDVVRDDVFKEIKENAVRKWYEGVQQQATSSTKIQNPDYFKKLASEAK
jgi:parvulin-like peptidyl-prolyl isomerase